MTLPHKLCCFSFPVLLLGHVQFEGDFPQVAFLNPSEFSTIGLHNFQITLITITNSEFFFKILWSFITVFNENFLFTHCLHLYISII